MSIGALLSAALLIVGDPSATQADGSKAPTVIVNPSWRTPPVATGDDYPAFAWAIGIQARVEVECVTTTLGLVKDCKAVRETPAGLGFGPAAVAIAMRGRVSPRRVDGVATDSRIMTRIPFSTDPLVRVQPKPWHGEEPTPAHLAAAEAFLSFMGKMPEEDFDALLVALPEARRAVVRSWIEELFPNRERTEAMFIRSLARTIPQRTLERWAGGEWSEKDLTEFEDVTALGVAMEDQFDSNAAFLELRRRYCERYDCSTVRPR
ncbi:energy transducer TonB [Brevundimonas faecalis]|uniref:TonB C-terminal domain-containing protein n=1 Tax=Brevundimonas faecalis TaxID=947378 RepID=A0ABV2RC68_9CAUL